MIRIGIHSDVPDSIVEQNLGGMLQFAADHGDMRIRDCRIALHGYDFRHSDPPWKDRVDGALISIGLEHGESPEVIADWVARGGVPVVSMAADILHRRIPVVCTEMASIARLAAQHLIEAGCRSFLHAGYALSMGSPRRAEAFRTELAGRGLELAEFEFEAKLEEEADRGDLAADAERLVLLLQSLPKPVGVLGLGDPFARGVVRVCQQAGLQVPNEVAVVGMDDTPLAFAQRPRLTSICYPGEEVAYRAMTLLVKLINGGRRPRKLIEVPATRINVRESTSSASKDGDDLASAVQMIADRAAAGLTVAELVEALSVSRRWLELEFRNHLGRSPNQEIQRVRLLRARRLLELSNVSITQVAENLGFAESSGLTHFFQKHTGYSPKEYRAWAHQVRGEA